PTTTKKPKSTTKKSNSLITKKPQSTTTKKPKASSTSTTKSTATTPRPISTTKSIRSDLVQRFSNQVKSAVQPIRHVVDVVLAIDTTQSPSTTTTPKPVLIAPFGSSDDFFGKGKRSPTTATTKHSAIFGASKGGFGLT